MKNAIKCPYCNDKTHKKTDEILRKDSEKLTLFLKCRNCKCIFTVTYNFDYVHESEIRE